MRQLAAAATLALFFCAGPLEATPTPAGTSISNIASISFGQSGFVRTLASNAATFGVAEELGVALRWDEQAGDALDGGDLTAIPVILTNKGNGHEAFVLDAAVQGLDTSVEGFAVATGQGAPTGPRIARGGHTAELAPGEAIRLLVFVRGRTAGRGTLTVTAHALTGFGQPGSSFPGRGDGGGDAVVGATTAAASLSRPLSQAADAGANEPVVRLEKAQAVLAPDGTANPVHGATILYTLVARVTGEGSASGAVLADPIPAGTDYVPGSLTLDGVALADAGDLDGSGIAVPLGDVPAGHTRTLTFKVVIR